MANWAVVIGVNQYWTAQACLKGAVRDALRMREWLLDPSGGAVPQHNLFLLLGPSDASEVPAGLRPHPATRSLILKVFERLLQRSGGRGERLFVYFSGHGLASRVHFSDEETLLPTDFDVGDTQKSISLRSIVEYLEATQFAEQFLFFDACRNIPWEGEFYVGHLPPRRRDPSQPAVQQFVFYATSPGVKAAEIREAGSERGAFTESLLEGLRGKGKAKAWDVASQEYIVRVERLLDFVVQEVSQKQLTAPDDAARRLLQVPRAGGERGAIGGSNPVLARFPPEHFGQEHLAVLLEPEAVAPSAAITVERDSIAVGQRAPVTELPADFALPPREYSVTAAAPNHEPEQRRWPVELYSPQQVTVSLRPTAPGAAPSEPPPTFPVGPAGATLGGGGGGPGRPARPPRTRGRGLGLRRSDTAAPVDAQRPATLIVEASDPLAPLEVADTTGQVLEIGEGRLQRSGLKPGFYRARLRTPEGQVVERLVELEPGEEETVGLDAPQPPVEGVAAEALAMGRIERLSDNSLLVSESLGPLASAQLSTILTMAGSVATFNIADLDAPRLRNLGLSCFQARGLAYEPSGLQLLFGFEGATPDEGRCLLEGVKLRLWPQDAPVPDATEAPLPFSDYPGLGEFASPAAPGPHWLAVELGDQPPVVFALGLLPERLTMLVFHLDTGGRLRVFQYCPTLSPDEWSQPTMLRRLELMQRFYLNGLVDRAYHTAVELLQAKWAEPIAGCLGGYLLIRLGKAEQLEVAAGNMLGLYEELSDSHVLMGAYLASRGWEDDAAAHAAKALDLGLPTFADGLMLLADAVAERGIDHPRAPLLAAVAERRLRGLLWSAWAPRALTPGQPLEP